jgi:hypothetical protein
MKSVSWACHLLPSRYVTSPMEYRSRKVARCARYGAVARTAICLAAWQPHCDARNGKDSALPQKLARLGYTNELPGEVPARPAIRSGAWAAPGRAGSAIAKLLKGAPAIYRHAGCRVVLRRAARRLTQSSDTFACAG